MFDTVVVPLDGSSLGDNVLAGAAAVARRCDARMMLVQVVRTADEEAEAGSGLRDLAEGIGNVRTEVATPRGRDAAEAIAAAAAACDDPLVCMSTHGRGGAGRALLGSVAEAVVQRHSGPVLLVGPNADIGAIPLGGRVTVCLDGSATAESVLSLARGWAEAFAMGLELVGVVGTENDREPHSDDASPADDDLGGYLTRCGRSLRAEGVDVEWSVLHGGQPTVAIVDHVERHRPGLVAMSTHGRSGLARIALGSVAMGVVRDSPRPVLLRRPPRDG